ncbi:MAG: hypothetical protein A2X49_00625 [Lentisphaerae bacterium GWF2_52_8]|nr:MAG: hypothetical protein A2X49_00625 [Lentisphaerae bacterium GWF2_52_8]
MNKPDYCTLKKSKPFSWNVSSTYLALLEISGVEIKEMFLKPAAGIELYKKGRPMLREMFGAGLGLPAPITPPISYGHINTLGAELIFPEGGEVNHGVLCNTLQDGIEILKKPVDFGKAGMLPYYLEYQRKMQEAFPDEKVGFAYKGEGPITTAYLLRRDEFFYDPYDNPEQTKEFLRLITESIIKFNYFLRKELYAAPLIDPGGTGLADDVAAMLSPAIWPEFVIPYIEQYYNGLTTGERSAHIEDLRPEHLHFLEELQLVGYDPSVSPKVNPKIISEKTRVPFQWRLCNFHYPSMTSQDISDFVFQAVADGASGVFTYVCHGMCNNESIPKVHSFMSACKQVDKMLNQEGASREEVGKLVSLPGKKKFWDNWPS